MAADLAAFSAIGGSLGEPLSDLEVTRDAASVSRAIIVSLRSSCHQVTYFSYSSREEEAGRVTTPMLFEYDAGM